MWLQQCRTCNKNTFLLTTAVAAPQITCKQHAYLKTVHCAERQLPVKRSFGIVTVVASPMSTSGSSPQIGQRKLYSRCTSGSKRPRMR